MTPELEVEIGKAIFHTLKRNKSNDMIVLSEAIKEAVVLSIVMNTEDSGVAEISEETAWNLQAMQAERPVKKAQLQSAIPPAPPKSVQPVDPAAGRDRLIILPGDPEFKADLKAPTGEKVVIAALEPTRKGKRPAANVEEVQYWDPGQLIAEIDKNTPNEIHWYMEHPERGQIPMLAKKNIINQAGLGSVVLTYKHPSVTDHPSPNNIHDLTAKVYFSVYKQEFDVEAALVDIEAQLKGMYKYREPMEPSSGPEPPPLGSSGMTFNMRSNPMGTTYEDRFDPNLKPSIMDNDARWAANKGAAMQRVYSSNKKAAD